MEKYNMILVMIDECGEEREIAHYNLSLELDDDELDIWQSRKIDKAIEEYPEARGFYFEDRRQWGSMIARSLHEWF